MIARSGPAYRVDSATRVPIRLRSDFTPEQKPGANFELFEIVHLQQSSRYATNLTRAHKVRAVEPKMIVPHLCAGIEKFDNRACFQVQAGQVGTFVQIAVRARQSEIG